MLRRTLSLLSVLTASAALVATPAHALTFSTAELSYDNALISQFNLVTLGNLNQPMVIGGATTIGGRALVGGNATFAGSPTVCTVNCGGNTTTRIDPTGQSFGALTVFGNLVTPGNLYNTANLGVGAGDVSVRGTVQGNLAMNQAANSSGSLRVVGSAQNTTNVANATAITTSQSSFAGNSVRYNYATGLYLGNGVTPTVNKTIASVFPFNTSFADEANSFSKGLASLPGTQGVKTQTLTVGNGIFFTANSDYVNGGKSYGVITTTVADLAAQTNFKGINNNGNAATIVIVKGDGANYTLPNLNSYAGASNVIFDFVEAKTLNFGGAWTGSILAPLADIKSMLGAIDGSVIVNSINQTQALYATNLFAGDLSGLVPEPASIALFGAGLAALGLARRRRK